MHNDNAVEVYNVYDVNDRYIASYYSHLAKLYSNLQNVETSSKILSIASRSEKRIVRKKKRRKAKEAYLYVFSIMPLKFHPLIVSHVPRACTCIALIKLYFCY